MSNSLRTGAIRILVITGAFATSILGMASARPGPGPGIRVPTRLVLKANDTRIAEFRNDGPLILRSLGIRSGARVFWQKLERYGDVTSLGVRDNREIESHRLVWAVMLQSDSAISTPIGRFRSNAMVLNIVDSETKRLLGFRVYGRLIDPRHPAI